jgi:pilus assembly protein CpaB
MNSRMTLLGSAIAGVLAAVFAYAWFSSAERSLREMSSPAPVLVASRYIACGARVDASAVEVKAFPRAFIQPGALAAVKDAEGQLALAPIAPGEQVLANKLTKGGVALALAVPPGKRAVTVAVDAASGVAGLLKPGDLVDVLVTTDEGGAPRTSALMQAAPVLAVGRTFSAEPARKEEEGSLLGAQAATVTLAASPFEAAQLVHFELAGRVKLLLRAPGDVQRIPLAPIAGRSVRAAPAGDDEEVRQR